MKIGPEFAGAQSATWSRRQESADCSADGVRERSYTPLPKARPVLASTLQTSHSLSSMNSWGFSAGPADPAGAPAGPE
ncbi:hypothetical protein Kisp02_62560 [Kineosporia sp. NBRC 101731]|nr:hypothetical protein Kisp02_62560 [Kineosporia sp. NBRC 101731]